MTTSRRYFRNLRGTPRMARRTRRSKRRRSTAAHSSRPGRVLLKGAGERPFGLGFWAMKLWLALILALLASGCGQSAPELPAAHNKIPVYPNATYKESMGGTTSDLGSGQALTESLSWWLTFADS